MMNACQISAYRDAQSLKITLIDAIMALEAQAEEARMTANYQKSRQLAVKSIELAKKSVNLLYLQSRIRSSAKGIPTAKSMTVIAKQAQDLLNRIQKSQNTLSATADLYQLIDTLEVRKN